jgi:hypothetical protein
MKGARAADDLSEISAWRLRKRVIHGASLSRVGPIIREADEWPVTKSTRERKMRRLPLYVAGAPENVYFEIPKELALVRRNDLARIPLNGYRAKLRTDVHGERRLPYTSRGPFLEPTERIPISTRSGVGMLLVNVVTHGGPVGDREVISSIPARLIYR